MRLVKVTLMVIVTNKNVSQNEDQMADVYDFLDRCDYRVESPEDDNFVVTSTSVLDLD